MTSTIAEFSVSTEYKVVIVEQTEAPSGMPGDWYRYVIQRGASEIVGLQTGGLNKVTEHAENFAESLNERLTKKVYAYGSQPKKKTI